MNYSLEEKANMNEQKREKQDLIGSHRFCRRCQVVTLIFKVKRCNMEDNWIWIKRLHLVLDVSSTVFMVTRRHNAFLLSPCRRRSKKHAACVEVSCQSRQVEIYAKLIRAYTFYYCYYSNIICFAPSRWIMDCQENAFFFLACLSYSVFVDLDQE